MEMVKPISTYPSLNKVMLSVRDVPSGHHVPSAGHCVGKISVHGIVDRSHLNEASGQRYVRRTLRLKHISGTLPLNGLWSDHLYDTCDPSLSHRRWGGNIMRFVSSSKITIVIVPTSVCIPTHAYANILIITINHRFSNIFG